VLDECTSALDPTKEAAALESVCTAKFGCTTVVVTHELREMCMRERILVVHDGGIAEIGTYDELMVRNGLFASLVQGGVKSLPFFLGLSSGSLDIFVCHLPSFRDTHGRYVRCCRTHCTFTCICTSTNDYVVELPA
jgi:energy-coupling factor transporter ATP-binding protein EcfA2